VKHYPGLGPVLYERTPGHPTSSAQASRRIMTSIMARTSRNTAAAIELGALAPLSSPGLMPAGLDLRDGMAMAVDDVNRIGGVCGQPLKLVVRDTGAGPAAAVAAVEQLAADGIAALVGEFHSAVAVPVSSVATRLGLPFLCASATADAVVRENPEWVFRLAAQQSRGWRFYANYLMDRGCKQVVMVVDQGEYWLGGMRALQDQFTQGGVEVSIIARSPDDDDELEMIRATGVVGPTHIVLLLVDYPEPFTRILRAIRRCGALRVKVGDPAGRVAFPECLRALGSDAAGIPYLAYLPPRLTSHGERVHRHFTTVNGREPSFVFYEGYDSAFTVAAALRAAGPDRRSLRDALERVDIEATRARIVFTASDHQWCSPVRVDVASA
jgi:ABC-type branched-subunit amino acid transport system substrate-binding protein